MGYRKLTIEFRENGDVHYGFCKGDFEYGLYKYVINHPFEQVKITGGQDVYDDNFRISKMSNGFTLLEWDKVKDGYREVEYIKQDYLKKISLPDGTTHFRYFEQLNIKALNPGDEFYLWLHSPYSKISAIKSRSIAGFNGISYKPRELSEIVFRQSGLLTVDWELEIMGE